MTQEFTTQEKCECKDNEKEERRIIQIQSGASETELLVTEFIGQIRQGPERVTKGQVTTPFGRSFDMLFDLGPGLHSSCTCKSIGPKDAIFKPRQD